MIRPSRFALLLAILPIAIIAFIVSLYPSSEQLRFGATKDGEIVACQQIDIFTEEYEGRTSGFATLINTKTGAQKRLPKNCLVSCEERNRKLLVHDVSTSHGDKKIRFVDRDTFQIGKEISIQGSPEIWTNDTLLCGGDHRTSGLRLYENLFSVNPQVTTRKAFRYYTLNETHWLELELVEIHNTRDFSVRLYCIDSPSVPIASWEATPISFLGDDKDKWAFASDKKLITIGCTFKNQNPNNQFLAATVSVRNLDTGAVEREFGLELPAKNEQQELMSIHQWKAGIVFDDYQCVLLEHNEGVDLLDLAKGTLEAIPDLKISPLSWYSDRYIQDTKRRFFDLSTREFIEAPTSRSNVENKFIRKDGELITCYRNGEIELSTLGSNAPNQVINSQRYRIYFIGLLLLSLFAWQLGWFFFAKRESVHLLFHNTVAVSVLVLPIWFVVKRIGLETHPDLITTGMLSGIFTGIFSVSFLRLGSRTISLSHGLLWFSLSAYLVMGGFQMRGARYQIAYLMMCLLMLVLMTPLVLYYRYRKGSGTATDVPKFQLSLTNLMVWMVIAATWTANIAANREHFLMIVANMRLLTGIVQGKFWEIVGTSVTLVIASGLSRWLIRSTKKAYLKGLVSVPGFYLLACSLGFFLPGLFAGTLQPPITFLDAITFLLIPIIRPVSAMWMLFFLLVHAIVLSPERLRVGGRISVKREIDDDSRSRSELAIDT